LLEVIILSLLFLKGIIKCAFFQEIFGPVLAVTTFKTTEEAIEIANDTMYGLGAGVWTRDAHEIYQIPRAIQSGRVWVNQYHSYPGAPLVVQTIGNRT
jgi:aldehyde dehydrogenase